MSWNDPSFLRSASAGIQWLVIALASLAVCLQTAKHFIDLREKRISSSLTALKEKDQQNREEELREKLETSEKRIKSLDLELSIDIVAKWKAGMEPIGKGFMWTGSKAVIITFKLSSGAVVSVDFVRAENVNYTRIDAETVRLTYRTFAVPGSAAFSLLPEQILAIQSMEFVTIGLSPDILDETVVTISRLHAAFIANGRVSFAATDAPQMAVDIKGAQSGTPKLNLSGHIDVVHPK